jgi:hypothetical protein
MVKGYVDDVDKDDLYKMNVERGQSLHIFAEPASTLGINLYLYLEHGEGGSATQEQVGVDRAPTIGETKGYMREINYTANSVEDEYTMYAWVGFYEGEGEYNLTVEVEDQDDANSDTDAGDTFEDALLLYPGTYDGYVAFADDEDLYKVELVKGDSIYVDAQPEAGLSVNIQLFREVDKDGLPEYQEVAKDKRTGDEGRGEHRHVEYTLNSAEEATTMYIRVYRDQDSGTYVLKIGIDHQDDAGLGTDGGDTAATAGHITKGGNYAGFLKGLDVVDYYRVELKDRDRIWVNVTPDATLTVSVVLTVDNTEVAAAKANHPEHEYGDTRSVNHSLPRTTGMTAIIMVDLEAGDGNYSLDITIIPKPEDNQPPVVVLVDPAPGSVLKGKRIWDYKGTATDYNEVTKVELSFDNIVYINCTLTGSAGKYNWNGTIRFPKSGNQTLYVRATDNMGNTGTTGFYVKFKKRKKEPGFEAIPLMTSMLLVALLVALQRRRRK